MADEYSCELCPRSCGVNRGERKGAGYCKESAELRIAFAGLHQGEEPVLTGAHGSGTVFVSGCNLGCNFCQNHQINGRAAPALGRAVNEEEFTGICAALQERGAANINIVTGSHAIPALARVIRAARDGIAVPFLWNSSAYEKETSLRMLGGLVDIFLPDLKTLDSDLAGRYFNAPDYPKVAAAAVLRMIQLAEATSARVIVRHLVLPGELASTRQVLRWFAENAVNRALLSLLFQFTPCADAPSRPVNKKEYDQVIGWLEEFGIEDGFCQNLTDENTGWLPDFEKSNPFPSDLSIPVWHWRDGFI
ncbi:MAG: radical SAM protein [Treponema sp.]|jgi:putative pyruvate formate lyase activating enzyme|nr:radical SAM protein [Treponema sp.]